MRTMHRPLVIVLLCITLAAAAATAHPLLRASVEFQPAEKESEATQGLTALWRPNLSDLTCSLVRIDPATGNYTTIAAVVPACTTDRHDPNSRPLLAYDRTRRLMYYATGSGTAVHAIDATSGKEVRTIPLPAAATKPDVLQLALLVDAASDTLYCMIPGQLYAVHDASKSGVTWRLTAAVNNKDEVGLVTLLSAKQQVYYFQSSTVIGTLDLPTKQNTPHTLTPALTRSPLTIQSFESDSSVYFMADLSVYTFNPANGAITTLMSIPNGPGYPFVAGKIDATKTYIVSDFEYLYLIDLTSKTWKVCNFPGYRTEAGYVWVD